VPENSGSLAMLAAIRSRLVAGERFGGMRRWLKLGA